ncbi:ABC transporter permease [Clostridium tetanomorphum]|uniref:ABC transporter permease n=2 Tax=Clostridium tetanomorphum TaxID=1553 RepID=A0A923EDX6_CLOTT|nr:ABC transporter permease [Clostridium tetanomorphum]
MIRTSSIVFALVLVAIFIALLGLNPIDVYFSMIKGAFGSIYSVKETIVKAIPLIITALGISVAFKMQFWNIGGEGQIIMGAFLSSYFALKFPELNSFLLLIIMVLAGIIGGAIWAYIPAFFKCKWGTNETIVTLMMNYIALKFITYLQYGPWKDPNAQGFPKIPNFSENAILPDIFGVHIGWIIAFILVIFIYIFMNYTKKGYEITVLGESEKTALYAGINIKSTIVVAMILSGGLCGLAGMIQASAVSNTLSVQVSGGIGYTAIIVAWLSNLSAPLILMVSILFAALLEGGSFIQTAFGIPESAALILQSTILFFILGSEFFIRYKFTKRSSLPSKEVA